MFTNKAKANLRQIDDEIGLLLDSLNGLSTEDEQYDPTFKKIKDLYQIKAEQAKTSGIAPRDFLNAGTTVGTILLITLFEASGHTIASKALAFVRKS